MFSTPKRITHYTPLPPARNGIADYAWRMMDALRPHFRQSVITTTSNGRAPKGIKVYHDLKCPAEGLRVYQIGNNWFHTEELKMARSHPGVVILHDLQLLYLYQSLGLDENERRALMAHSAPALSDRTIWDFESGAYSGKLPYMLCAMTSELVERSLAIVVHSRYAKTMLERQSGGPLDHVHVIPHFAMEAAPRDRNDTRLKLGIKEGTLVVLTSGFAAPNKRFDDIAKSVHALVGQFPELVWVHAGNDRHDNYNLHDLVARFDGLDRHFKATGYLGEDTLDDWVAVSDVFMNLRFPSVGESSGSLARALSQGACVVVTDTGSYAEIPDDSAIKISALASAQDMTRIIAALLRAPDLRSQIGANAARYARDQLAIEKYAINLGRVLHAADSTQHKPLFSFLHAHRAVVA